MNYRFHSLRIFGSSSVLYYIFYSSPYQSTARNKVKQFNLNYFKNAYESYSQLARYSLTHSYRTYQQSDSSEFYKHKRSYRFLPVSAFHVQSILNSGKSNDASYDSKRRLQDEKNDSSGKVDESDSKSNEEGVEKMSLVKRFKLMYKQYWYVLLPVHVVTSTVWYGSFFFAAKSGIDIVPMLEYFGTSESVLAYFRSSDAGYYGVAYAMYKLATPARYTVTLGGTTLSINYLVARGYIKPVPTKKELKHMFEDKKGEIKEKTDEMKEKYMEKKGEILEKYLDKTEEMRGRYEEKKNELMEKYSQKKSNFNEKKRR